MEFVHEGIEFTHVSRMILLFIHQKKFVCLRPKKWSILQDSLIRSLLTLYEFFCGLNCEPCSSLKENKIKIRAFGETCLLSDFQVLSLIQTFLIIRDLFKVCAEQVFGYDCNLEKLLWVRGECKCMLDFTFQWRSLL